MSLIRLFRFALGEQHVEFAFKLVIIDTIVQFIACLHHVDDVALMAVAALLLVITLLVNLLARWLVRRVAIGLPGSRWS